MARQMTEDELLDYFEINFNLAADARKREYHDEAVTYEAFNRMIEWDLHRFQPAWSPYMEDIELLSA